MYVTTQLCGLVILFIIAYIVQTHKDLGVFSDKLFHRLLWVNIGCLGLDILSIHLIVQNCGGFLQEFVCKAYLVSLFTLSYMLSLYIHTDNNHLKDYSRFLSINKLIFGFGVVVIFCSKIQYYNDETAIYTYGDSATFTYLFTFYMMLGSLLSLYVNRKDIPAKKRRTIFVWIGLWICAALVQYFHPRLLVVGFASALGSMIMFFELENPESNLDKSTGLFNYYSLYTYLDYLKQKAIPYKMIMLTIPNIHDYEDHAMELRKLLIERMEKSKTGVSFRYADNKYIYLFFPEKEDAITEIEKERLNKASKLHDYAVAILSDTAEMDMNFLLQELYGDDFTEGTFQYITTEDYQNLVNFYTTKQMIAKAIYEDRITIYLQPIYGIKQERFISAEVLVRIIDEKGKLIQPNVFIPVAEKTGQITRIGDIVFRKTCQFIRDHDLDEMGLDYLEMNLAVQNGENPNLWWNYSEILKEYNIDSSKINMEITETDSVKQKVLLLENMHHMIEHGFSFSLDDFGSGQSNMDYLREMPVSIVKFDKEMTQNFFSDDVSKIILRGTLSIIKNLNKKTVSEGVETEEHFKRMVELGIDYIQGYYFSRPLPVEDFVTFIETNNKIKGAVG